LLVRIPGYEPSGREFSYEMLASVSPLDEQALRERLDRLVEAQVLTQNLEGQQAVYVFRHALIRDAAYDTLLRKDRYRHHRKVAETLVE
jgi:predicted ATPase